MLFTLETERESSVKGFTELIVNSVRGFCMALADSVPGVSGGTVAFLLGFYDRFIGSLDDLFHGARAARFAAVRFLLKLGAGWAIGFGLSALVLTSFFDTHIYEVSSLFMGFIVFAIPIVVREELDALRKRLPYLAFAVVGVAFVVAVTLLSPVSGEGIDVAAKSLDLGLVAYVFLAAMAAISAMVLPGISGSTLLLIFGLYVPIMGAVRATMGLDLSYLPILMVFAAGIACGMLLFVRLIRMCLERFRSQTIYAIIGMMLGSLFSITQGAAAGHEPRHVQHRVLPHRRRRGRRAPAAQVALGGTRRGLTRYDARIGQPQRGMEADAGKARRLRHASSPLGQLRANARDHRHRDGSPLRRSSR